MLRIFIMIVAVLACSHNCFAQFQPFVNEATNPLDDPEVSDFAALIKRLDEAEKRIQELEVKGEANSMTYFLTAAADKEKKDETKSEIKPKEKPKEKTWFEKYKVAGYAQFRFNETIARDSDGARPHHVGDSSIGENQSFAIRRGRLTFSGDVNEHISIYIQPEFSATVSGVSDTNFYVQMRDLYADLYFDKEKEYRVRVGFSKVPYGWESLQSSRDRIALDRSESFNSAVRNERDIGAFFYWTPTYAQDFFKRVADEGLKGSGNYGVFGFGAYNGQGGFQTERNDNLHLVSRLTLPITFSDGQMMEVGIQGYMGDYTTLSSPISPNGVGAAVRPLGTLETGNADGTRDQRVGASFIYYPQPFGVQAEWNVGTGPALNDAQTQVVKRHLNGGYVMIMYREITQFHGEFIPFARYSLYEGGYKVERNSPFAMIEEYETGVEWQINKNLELTGSYTITDRTNTRANSTANTISYNQFKGDILRLQLQIKY